MKNKRIIKNDILLSEVSRQLIEGKTVKLKAKGNSMQPFINGETDILVIEPINDGTFNKETQPDSSTQLIHSMQNRVLRKGDIVLAKIRDYNYVVHRILRISGDRFTLMGDTNLYQTEECIKVDILGIVKSLIRNGNQINLSSPYSKSLAFCWHLLLPLRRLRQKFQNNQVFS